MPTLDITSEDTLNSTIEILSIISHPADDSIRLEYKANYILQTYISACSCIDNTSECPRFSDYFCMIKLTSMAAKDFQTEADVIGSALRVAPSNIITENLLTKKVMAVGLILLSYYIIASNGQHASEISLKKSVYIASKLFSISEKTLWLYFKESRDAAHIYSAFAFFQFASNDNSIAPHQCLDVSNINNFIGLSEQIRLFFESKTDKRTQKTVLDCHTTWKAPPSFPVEENEIITSKDVLDIFMGILEGYAKRHLS